MIAATNYVGTVDGELVVHLAVSPAFHQGGCFPGLAARVWAAFWHSKVSGAVDVVADGEALRHWIRCVDEREKLRAATVRAPLVKRQP